MVEGAALEKQYVQQWVSRVQIPSSPPNITLQLVWSVIFGEVTAHSNPKTLKLSRTKQYLESFTPDQGVVIFDVIRIGRNSVVHISLYGSDGA